LFPSQTPLLLIGRFVAFVFLWPLSGVQDLSGAKVEKVCELVNIAINKNTVPGDKSAMNPSGIRIGV